MNHILRSTVCLMLLSIITNAGMRLERSNVQLRVDTLAANLKEPIGLAIHPVTRDVVVAEKGAGQISILVNKKSYGIVYPPLSIGDVPNYAITIKRNRAFWNSESLKAPESICFDNDGALLVAEGGGGGRILKFADIEGEPNAADIITTPWESKYHGTSSIQSNPEGDIYTTAIKLDPDGLPFGNVLKRDKNNDWWLIDYGPFANFSNVLLSPDGEFAIIGERRSADIHWYDLNLKTPIAAIEGVNGLRHMTMLKDGTVLAALERKDKTWSIVEVDPGQLFLAEWIGGLSTVGALLGDDKKSAFYVSLPEEGKVLRIRLKEELPKANKLMALRKEFEKEKFFPPLEWPEFLKPFIERLNVVQPVNSRLDKMAETGRSKNREVLTLGEFAKNLPIIAGKLTAELIEDKSVKAEDPIKEVHFIMFAPDSDLRVKDNLVPSMGLFFVEHESGKTHTTQFMHDMMGVSLSEDSDWDEMPYALMTFPYADFIEQHMKTSNKKSFRIAYHGMGLGKDYFLEIHPEHPEKNIMQINNINKTTEVYGITPFKDAANGGGQALLIANIDLTKEGWYKIGPYPVANSVILEQTEPMNFKHGIKLHEFASDDIILEDSVAENFKKRKHRQDLDWPRKVVRQAAMAWGEEQF